MQFVYGWPDYDCAVSNLEWEIGTARVLGLPVPSLAPYVGMTVGRSSLRVDAHGDNLARVETEGGYWRWAHDGWLETVYADCAHHGLRVAREITGLFRSAIPLPGERALFDRRPWNVRRGMIPDGSVATGHGPDRLLECKFLHWGVSTYTEADLEHEGRCRAVERRAGKVHDDYVKAAAKLDAAHCGTLPDARPGPVELKLASLGPVQPLVVGHYGEMGGYVDGLLELAADAGADKHWQSMRCRDPDTARGIILQVLRRSWGMAAFRENARLIVRRLGRVGDARASATIRNSESTHRRLRRIYENAAEHYRCVTTSGKHGRRH